MKRDFKILVATFLLFTLFSLLIFWPIFAGKVNLNGNLLVSFYAPYGENLPFKNSGWDQLRIYFPFLRVTLESIKNFQIPLWNSYAFSGHPHMADFQTAVFYPLNIFGLIFSQIEFWHLLRITPSILAAFFTYLYLRSLPFVILETRRVDRISNGVLSLRSRMTSNKGRMTNKGGGLSDLASIFGALTFGFSPFILTWGEEVVMSPHSIVWLPLILWGIEKFLASSRHPGVATTTIGSASQILRSSSLGKLGTPALRISRDSIALLRSLQNDRTGYLVIIALSSAFSFFSGYMQTTIYMFIFIGAYLIFRIWTGSVGVKLFHPWGGLRLHLRILASFGLGAGIAAVQLLPSAELFFNAARSEIALREKLFDFLLPIESVLTYLAPDFFGHPATANFFRRGDAHYYEGILFVGVAALIFALHSLKLRRASPRDHWAGLSRFFVISGVLALLTTIDWFGAKLFLSFPVPFLSTSIPNRILFIPAFCLAVLAAGGLDRWTKERLTVDSSQLTVFKPVLVIAGIYGGILVTLGLVKIFGLEYFEHKQFTADANWLVTVRNLAIPMVVFATTVVLITTAVLHRVSKRNVAILIIAVSFLHIWYFSQKYFSFSDRQYTFPMSEVLEFVKQNQTFYRSWGVGEAFLENNFASQYGIFFAEGYDSLNNRSYGEFTYAMQGARIDDFVFRADAGLGRGQTGELMSSADRRRLVDMVGVKYVIGKVSDREVMEKNNFKLVYPEVIKRTDNVVFENLAVMPRAFLASNYEGPPDVFGEEPKTVKEKSQREKLRRELIPQKLLGEDFDWRNVVILEKPSTVSPQFGPGTVEIVSYKSREVIINTKSDQPKLLFLSDNYYPGWKAQVDGDETGIWRANYTFRAVPLVPGEHTVRFYYDPWSFKLGLIVSVLSVAGLGFSLLMQNSKVKNQNAK